MLLKHLEYCSCQFTLEFFNGGGRCILLSTRGRIIFWKKLLLKNNGESTVQKRSNNHGYACLTYVKRLEFSTIFTTFKCHVNSRIIAFHLCLFVIIIFAMFRRRSVYWFFGLTAGWRVAYTSESVERHAIKIKIKKKNSVMKYRFDNRSS